MSSLNYSSCMDLTVQGCSVCGMVWYRTFRVKVGGEQLKSLAATKSRVTVSVYSLALMVTMKSSRSRALI